MASYDAKITIFERIVSSLAARIAALETNAASASSGSGSTSSWNVLGHGDGSTAAGFLGSHGPGSADDKNWSSQDWKSDELMEVRTGRPVVFAQHTDRFIFENEKMNSYTEAESEMSLESRSFLHRVNVQVRKRQKQSSKDATKDSDKHTVIWRMFMSSTLQASVFMVKNYSDKLHSIKKYRRSHNETDVQHI